MNYSTYYLSTPLQTKGIKPIYGATGLGKTFGARQAILQTLKTNPQQKFIYLTNRHALIEETNHDLTKDGITVCYLKGDIDQLRELRSRGLLRDIIFSLFGKGFFNYLLPSKDEIHYKLTYLFEILDKREKELQSNPSLSVIKQEIAKIHNKLLRLIRNAFYQLRKNRKATFDSFLQDKEIWQLFPFIQFENDPEANVLLGTVQKFCYGYFDGRKQQKLHQLKHRNGGENYVIFMDEFDFLENEILDILSQEPQLYNSIAFVRFFMEDFGDLQHNDFWEKDKDLTKVKAEMQQIMEYLTQTTNKYNFDFPRHRRFYFSDDDFKTKEQQYVLFQNSNHPLVSQPFYLEQGVQTGQFKIVRYRTLNTVYSFAFFNMIKTATEKVLRVFNHLRDRPLLLNALIEEFWDSKNDRVVGAYHRYILENHSYRTVRRNQMIKRDFDYTSGYSLITLKRDSLLDPNLATVEQLELVTSPEAIIAELSNNNLVFALSATLDIPRMVNAFNLEWLKTNTNFIEPSIADLDLVEQLIAKKQSIRQGSVRYQITPQLVDNHYLNQVIDDLALTNYYQEAEEHGRSRDFRVATAKNFFGCFDWIVKQSNNRTHLVFSNTFKRELPFFSDQPERKLNNVIKKRLSRKGFKVKEVKGGFKVSYNETSINLIFLNAATNKQLAEDPKLVSAYDQLFLDKEATKVILVTQYATASNGLNLRCLAADDGREIDFEGIHLLEPRHFWFDTDDTNRNDFIKNKKKVFWYYWKLYHNQQLNGQRLQNFLRKVNLKEFNNYYKETYEYVLNQIALFHQTLGRVDRKWQSVVPIEITLGRAVHNIFVDFLTQPAYYENQEIIARERTTATFILQLNEQIKKVANREIVRAQLSNSQNIALQQEESRQTIQELLDAIKTINKGELSDIEARKIIHTWQQIRHYVLRQDWQAMIDEYSDYRVDFSDLTFETNLLQADDKLYVAMSEFILYSEPFKIEEEIFEWDLNHPYRYLIQNAYLCEEFEQLGYPTYFVRNNSNHQHRRICTPYIQQGILIGAIGEEAIKCLLNRAGFYCEGEGEADFELFELFDAKLRNLPIYIDFKNFSKRTQSLFELPEDDYLYNPDFDSRKFLQKVKRKRDRIVAVTGKKDVKYIVVNFVASQDIRNKHFDPDLNLVTYATDCSIMVVPSALSEENPSTTSTAFDQLIQFFKSIQLNSANDYS